MKLTLQRFSAGNESTLGLMFVNNFFICYTIEDEKRTVKKYGETRIPAGVYNCKLRTHGGHHHRYLEKFPGLHMGMIELLDVEGFTDILIHIGNDDTDTNGCILVGNGQLSNLPGRGKILSSTNAYKSMYLMVIDSLVKGNLFIEVKDENEMDL